MLVLSLQLLFYRLVVFGSEHSEWEVRVLPMSSIPLAEDRSIAAAKSNVLMNPLMIFPIRLLNYDFNSSVDVDLVCALK